MKKEVREILKLTKMISPQTPYYIAGVKNAQDVVTKFMKKPSFTDKLK
jgi:cytochrome c556